MIGPGLWIAGAAAVVLVALAWGSRREQEIRKDYTVSRDWIDGKRGL